MYFRLWIFLGVILLLVFWGKEQRYASKPAETINIQSKVDPSPPPPPAVRFTNSAEVISHRNLARAEENLRISRFPLEREGDQLRLTVQFAPLMLWCQIGDLDIMRIDQKNDGMPPLIMTIEPLISRDDLPIPYLKSITLDQLSKGLEHSFNLRVPKENAYLGLFVCQDRNGEGTCLRKRVGPFHKIYEEYTSRIKPGVKPSSVRYRVQDHLYYFQFLMIRDKKLALGDPSLFDQEDYQAAFADYLGKSDSKLSQKSLAERVSNFSRNTGSIVGMNLDRKLVFRLPYNDPRCPLLPSTD